MADYRLSAQIIKRSTGKSAVAAAAYRAGLKLEDERTGLVHDYSRKGGVLHSEVMAPANTPDWMHDRAKLWNAVEAVEKRKNSQLAREIQLSLPHELTPEQRTKLVQDFVQEQFVARGMIADIAIHAPNPKGDERNHHAHIMLTMRELTGEGFHSKKSTPTARSWNDDELLQSWRKEWALHQNRTLERHGHSERVDHRSFADRGIDREPQQHLGVAANDMLAKGKQSRIDQQNTAISKRNSERAMRYAKAAQRTATMSEEFQKVAAQQKEKVREQEQERKQRQKQEAHKLKLEQQEKFKISDLQAEAKHLDRRLQSTGFKKVIRDLVGTTKRETEARNEMVKAIEISKAQMKKEQQELAAVHKEENRKAIEIEKQRQQEEKQKMSAKVFRDFERSRNLPAQAKSINEEESRRTVDKLAPVLKPKSDQSSAVRDWVNSRAAKQTIEKSPDTLKARQDWAQRKTQKMEEQPRPKLTPPKPPKLSR